MPIGERIALGVLLGMGCFAMMIGAFNLGTRDGNKRIEKQGITIDYLQSATKRFRSLYYETKKERDMWHDSLINVTKIK